MSDLHEAAMSALLHDIRAEQIQAAERRDFNDALAKAVTAKSCTTEHSMNQTNEYVTEKGENLMRELTYWPSGSLRHVEYFDENVMLHRPEGFASIGYREDGAIAYAGRFNRGVCISSKHPFDWGAAWLTLATAASAILIVGAALLMNIR